MKALILAADDFEDSELLCPLYRLREEGIDVEIASAKKGQLTGKHGYSIEADLTYAAAQAKDYDLLLIPGGKSPEKVRLDKKALQIVKKMMEEEKPVASICHGAQVLISAGVVKGRTATCWQGVQDDLKTAGAEVRDQEVVVDGNLITSRCPDDIPAFNREMMKVISKQR